MGHVPLQAGNCSYSQKKKEFQVVPKRWIVERTFGWFQWDRRLIIDYERKSSTAENMVYITSIGKIAKALQIIFKQAHKLFSI